jgi:hypothetical protein
MVVIRAWLLVDLTYGDAAKDADIVDCIQEAAFVSNCGS